MTIKVKDKNRAALVQTIIKQNGGRIFTVVAKRKNPVTTFILKDGLVAVEGMVELKEADFKRAVKKGEINPDNYDAAVSNFMEMTCRTGVKKDLKGGESTIKHKSDLISVNLTNGKGYRCFSAFNVLELRAGGTVIKFKEADVLAFQGE